MANSMLSENKGKKGSYTILVKKGYAVPQKSVKEIVKELSKDSESHQSVTCACATEKA